ncbi:YdgA family protein [Snodgrassella sp. CFCC 13594]|uniref:YdgA family protein n=1 Tax=Snodgrassella sp. CFCC 13594 TaxID=1775559 RepID=UPI0009EE1353|nr:YdgA family protein [Snodgrassella sp. CFCC 13594]
MNKRVGMVIAALVAVVLVVVLAVPYYMGYKAEQSLQDQQSILAKTSFLTVKQHTYERGWFSSTETTVVQFNPSFLASVQQQLPDNVKKVLQQPITLVNHVRHGLFAGSLRPVRAQVDTEFRFTPEVQQILMRFFGQQQPVSMHNTIFLSGSGQINVVVPKFNYEELSGIKLLWQGLQTQVDYASGYHEYDTHTTNPGLTLVLADKGQIAYEGLTIDTHTQEGQTELALGNSKLNLKSFSVQWNDALSYDVRLNDLINLVTNLQIGAFINPTGSVPPSKIVLHDLSFGTEMQEQGEWINSRGNFGFAKLIYGKETYGPLSIEASAEHLQAKSLLALKNKLTQLTTQKLSNDALQAAIIQAAKTEGLGLFTHDPVLKLNTFRFQMPDGLVDVHGQMAFKGLTAADMQQLNTMLAKTDAQFEFAVPQKLLEGFAISQARNLFTVDPSVGGPEALADIDETIRLMVDSTIRTMAQDGYVRVNKGVVQSQVTLSRNQLTLNGKKFVNEPEPDYWDNSASAPNAASTAQP